MVAAFCDLLSLQPSEVLVVGDTPHDLQMGRAAGAGLVVGVLSGTGTRELLESHCDHILENVLTLESLIPRTRSTTRSSSAGLNIAQTESPARQPASRGPRGSK